jgi:hypothetical protein
MTDTCPDAVSPAEFVAVQFTVVEPSGKTEPDGLEHVTLGLDPDPP